MKRIFLLLLSALMATLLLTPGALADASPERPEEVADGATGDFDGDGQEETLRFVISGEDEFDGTFTLSVGTASFTVEHCEILTGCIAALPISRGAYYNPDMLWGTLFFVDEYGPSDDPLSYCFFYTGAQLYDVGTIPALSRGVTVNADGQLTAMIRAAHIGTWSRPADYKLASGTSWEDGYEEFYHLSETPHDLYPMGMIVELCQDLPMRATRWDADNTVLLEAGQQVILAATDDVRWLYVTSLDGKTGGWVMMQAAENGYEDNVLVDGVATLVDQVFKNIIYAD